jgi:uncharacterized protein (TIGR00288 family)
MLKLNHRFPFRTESKIYHQHSFRQSSHVSRLPTLSPLDDYSQQYSKLHFALLIDGENCQRKKLSQLIDQISSLGITMPIRRMYHRSSSSALTEAKLSQKHALTLVPVQSVVKGKNIVDIAIIMDAMDLLHQDTTNLDGFILVSRDSDFCPLAQHLRKAGKLVIGVGHKSQITKGFAGYFNHFIFSNRLVSPTTFNKKTVVVESSMPPIDVVSSANLPVALLSTIQSHNHNIYTSIELNSKQVTMDMNDIGKLLESGEKLKKISSVENMLALSWNMVYSRLSQLKDSLVNGQKQLLPIELVNLLQQTLHSLSQNEVSRWVGLDKFIGIWKKVRPDFILRKYGYASYRKLFKSYPTCFKIETRVNEGNLTFVKCR